MGAPAAAGTTRGGGGGLPGAARCDVSGQLLGYYLLALRPITRIMSNPYPMPNE